MAQLGPSVPATTSATAADTVHGSRLRGPDHWVGRSTTTKASGRNAAATASGPRGASGSAWPSAVPPIQPMAIGTPLPSRYPASRRPRSASATVISHEASASRARIGSITRRGTSPNS
jgi:hypothetical protein